MKLKKSNLTLLSALIMGAIAFTGCSSEASSSADTDDTTSISSVEEFESIPGTSSELQVSNNTSLTMTAEAAVAAENIRLYFDDADMADKFSISYSGCDELAAGNQCTITVTQIAGDDSLAEGTVVNAYIQGENTKKWPFIILVDRLQIVDESAIDAISPGESIGFSIVNPTGFLVKGISFDSTAAGVSLSDDCENQIAAGSSCTLTITVESSAQSSDLDLSISDERYDKSTDGQILSVVRPVLTLSTNYPDPDDPNTQYNVVVAGQSISIIIYNNTAGKAYGLDLSGADNILPGLSMASSNCPDNLLANSQCTVVFDANTTAANGQATWTIPAGNNFNAAEVDIHIIALPDDLNMSPSDDYIITSSNTTAGVTLNVVNTTGYDVTSFDLSDYDNSKFTIDAAQSDCDDQATLAQDAECQYVLSYNPGEVTDYYTQDYDFTASGTANGSGVSATALITSINLELFYTLPFDLLLSDNSLPTTRNRFATVADVNGTAKLVSGTSGGLAISTDSGAIWNYLTSGKSLASNVLSFRAYLLDDANNLLYAGSDGGGFSVIDLDGEIVLKTYTTDDGLSSNVVNGFLQDGNNLFISTNDGVSVMDISSGAANGVFLSKVYSTTDGFGSNYTFGMLKIGDSLFIATFDGLAVLDISSGADQGSVTKNYTTSDGLGANGTFSLVQDGTDILVATSGGGLSILDISAGVSQGNVTKTYNTTDGVADNSVYSLVKNDNTIFIGNHGGLSVLDVSAGINQGTVSKTYTVSDGLSDNIVRALSFNDNTLYLSTEEGSLSLLDINPNDGSITVNSSKNYLLPSENIGTSLLYNDTIYGTRAK
ncbi:MAG: hypothetical protein ACO2ZM_09730 [Francisellaceae bacterium]